MTLIYRIIFDGHDKEKGYSCYEYSTFELPLDEAVQEAVKVYVSHCDISDVIKRPIVVATVFSENGYKIGCVRAEVIVYGNIDLNSDVVKFKNTNIKVNLLDDPYLMGWEGFAIFDDANT